MIQSRREFVRTLFVATQATVMGSMLPRPAWAADSANVPVNDGLNFLVVGDWGRKGEKEQVDVATQMALAAGKTEAKFVISVGDNFYEDGVSSVEDPHWESSFEQVYASPALQIPWHVILGNHDYHGNSEAQIAYSKKSERWNMPAPYFARTERVAGNATVDFFYLDTMPMTEFGAGEMLFHGNVPWHKTPDQMAWLERELAASTAPWKIVVGHHPIYSGGHHGNTPFLINHVLPLLEKHGVQAYLNGHDHDLQHLQAGGVNLFCAGAGSKPRSTGKLAQTKFALGCSGFLSVSLHPDTMTVRMIDDRGNLVYSVAVPCKA